MSYHPPSVLVSGLIQRDRLAPADPDIADRRPPGRRPSRRPRSYRSSGRIPRIMRRTQ